MKARNRYTDYLKKKLWKNPELIDEIFNNEEWKKHQSENELPVAASNKMYAHILQSVLRKKKAEENRSKLRSVFYTAGKYAAAAVFVLVVGWIISINNSGVSKVKSSRLAKVQHSIVSQPLAWVEVSNTDTDIAHISLPDSSVVTLYPQGVIKYEKGFSKPLRDIYLTGKAYFKVKRNPQRPFSVYAGGLKTTALGTSFTINTRAGRRKTSVQLHTGKIVVSPESKSSAQPAIYLSKAESGLLYDRRKQEASLMKNPVLLKPVLEISLSHIGPKISMKNIPMLKVISLLIEAYQVKIIASNQEIGNITYTGEVNTDKENIESVLQVICLINNMTLSRGTDQEYILKNSNK